MIIRNPESRRKRFNKLFVISIILSMALFFGAVFYILHTIRKHFSNINPPAKTSEKVYIDLKDSTETDFVFVMNIDSSLVCHVDNSFFPLDSAGVFLNDFFQPVENRSDIKVILQTNKSVPFNSLSNIFETLKKLNISFSLRIQPQ